MSRTIKHQVLRLGRQDIICQGHKSIKKPCLGFVEMGDLAKVIPFHKGEERW